MPYDAIIANPGRLRILTALASEPGQAFVRLRHQTGLTDGNLSTHARRLESAGFIAIQKSIASGKPLTTLHLTAAGREALAAHARSLLEVLDRPRPPAAAQASVFEDHVAADDWVD
jgi:DNA-binding MarR family transcriptional regulator